MRRGFTLVETTLVMALTALIFMAFVMSVSSSISGQRYSDSAQNFAEFLRSQYSAVINVQSSGTGNTNKAIYGRLITFGEFNDKDTIMSYDIIGKAASSDELGGNQSILTALAAVDATVFQEDNDGPTCTLRLINEESYDLTFSAWLETTASRAGQGVGEKFKGSILIVRSPVSGTVTTLFSNTVLKPSEAVGLSCVTSQKDFFKSEDYLKYAHGATHSTLSPLANFDATDINFCLGSDDQPRASVRRNIRIAKLGSNASAVQLINQESEDNQCQP